MILEERMDYIFDILVKKGELTKLVQSMKLVRKKNDIKL